MKILLTIKAVLNYLYNNLIDLVWVKKIKFEDNTEINTKPLNLFDIKRMSEAIANKNWCCISDSQPKRLSKADVPTAYEFLKDKLAGADETISGWQSLGDFYILYIVDDNVIISYDKIYYAKIVDISDSSKWHLLIDNTAISSATLFNLWIIQDIIYIYTGNQNGNLVMINKNTFEIIKTIPLSINQYGIRNLGFDDGYVYLQYFNETYGDHINKIKYSLVADEITQEVVQNSYQNAIRLIFRHSNGYYYFLQLAGSNLYFLYKATDVSDSSTYIYLGRLDQMGINAFYSDYNGNLIGISNSGTVKITTNIDNWTSDVSTQTWKETVLDFTNYGSAYTTAINLTKFYRSQNGFIFVFTTNDKQLFLYSTDLIHFNLILSLNYNVSDPYLQYQFSYNNDLDTNGSFATYNYTYLKTLYYSSPIAIPTVYTDTINGIDIKYYKNGNYKICTPDIAVGNDDNLQDVYEYLGYLNYWWIDTTNEQIALQRDNKLWTMMYVGDNYIDSNLPSGNYYPYATKNDIPNVNIYKEKAQTIEIDKASITIDNVLANKNYVFTNNAITDITLTACEKSFEETTIQFTTGSSAPTLTDNSGLVWFGGIPTLQANTTYVIVIFNKQAFYQEN